MLLIFQDFLLVLNAVLHVGYETRCQRFLLNRLLSLDVRKVEKFVPWALDLENGRWFLLRIRCGGPVRSELQLIVLRFEIQEVWHVLSLIELSFLLGSVRGVVFARNLSGFLFSQGVFSLGFLFLTSLSLVLDRESDAASVVCQLSLSEHLRVEVLLTL